MVRKRFNFVLAVVLLSVSVALAWSPTDEASLAAWFKADAGVVLHPGSATDVLTWQDQSGKGYDVTDAKSFGWANATMSPQLKTANLISGQKPIISFSSKDGLFGALYRALDNTSGTDPIMTATNTAVYVVAYSRGTSLEASMTVVEAFSTTGGGWVVIAERKARAYKPTLMGAYYEGTANVNNSLAPNGPTTLGWHYCANHLTNGNSVPKSNGVFDLWLDKAYFTKTGTPTYNFVGTSSHLSIGGRRSGDTLVTNSSYNGDVAEILIFTAVDANIKANVDAYIKEKYFTNPPVFPGNDPDLIDWYDGGYIATAPNPADPNADVIMLWPDRSVNGYDLNYMSAYPIIVDGVSTLPTFPLAKTLTFGNGSHQVVSFDGLCGFYKNQPNDGSPLRLATEQISVYAVFKNDTQPTSVNKRIVEAWSSAGGWSIDLAGDPHNNKLRFVAGDYPDHLSRVHPAMPVGDWELGYGTFIYNPADPNYIQTYYNGIASTIKEHGIELPIYHGTGGQHISIGGRRLGSNWADTLTGQIAEILVFKSVSQAQEDQVKAYLLNKYADITQPVLFDLTGDAYVDFEDFALLALGWDDVYVMEDLADMCETWLVQNEKPWWQ